MSFSLALQCRRTRAVQSSVAGILGFTRTQRRSALELPLMRATAFLMVAISAGSVWAQEPIALVEQFDPGYQYRVSCRVSIEGSLRVAADSDKPPEELKIRGKSVIEYHERILKADAGRVVKTVRKIHQLDFKRQVAAVEQESKLRPSIGVLVILRHEHFEVPFSPQGPLTWNEIDLVRTDVFVPALTGLLPPNPVKPGATWSADTAALRELTDLEQVEKGGLTCQFEGLAAGQKHLARVSFQGTVRGVGEDGPAEHQLDGSYYFDTQTRHLSYLSLDGRMRPLDKSGRPQGEIRGSFVLTRDPSDRSADLQDSSVKHWDLEPNEQNTLLLYESADVRFLYPRHWRISGVNGRQITLDERGGGGLLITLDPPANVPTAAQFQKEVHGWLGQQKARIVKLHPIRSVQTNPYAIDQFSIDAQINNAPVLLDYYVLRQSSGGATLAGRYTPSQAARLQRDVERIAQTVALTLK